jgi:hypothetical protein
MSALQVLTAILQARKGSTSLRTTIPETYVNMLRLKLVDKLSWDHEIVNNEIIVKIRKAKK